MKLLMRSFVFLSLLLTVVTGYAGESSFTTFTIKSCGFPLDAFDLLVTRRGYTVDIYFNKQGKATIDYPEAILTRVDYRKASLVCEALSENERQKCLDKLNKIHANLKDMGWISFDERKPPATYTIDKFSCF